MDNLNIHASPEWGEPLPPEAVGVVAEECIIAILDGLVVGNVDIL
jgi:hypothetical protein